ncbi:MAG: HAD-IIIC family phosphatase [Acidobacteria bacterium]|nr:HAD-IIIC family phosphatase [Acidobacteriota bacterium]
MGFKELIREARYTDALQMLLEIVKHSEDPNDLIAVSRNISKIPGSFYREQGFLPKKIAVLAGYSCDFITAVTRTYLLQHKIIADFHQTEYGLYEQAIHSRDKQLVSFAPDLCYFCVGSDQLGFLDVSDEIARWRALWQSTSALLSCDIVMNSFEEPLHRVFGNFECKWQPSASHFVRSVNAQLAQLAPGSVHFNDVNFLAGYHGRKNWRDERLYDMAKVPVSYDYLSAYARNLAAVCASAFGRSKKCLVLDLDNTLWGGVVADDGVGGIQIGNDSAGGEAYLRFQSYVRGLKDRGVILAVCSKNAEGLAREPFTARAEMVLKLEDISCFVANWRPKPENLVAISQQLEIGLDSMVFVDDNPMERDYVRQSLPQIEVVELGEDPSTYTATLSRAHYFETVAVTGDDLKRTEQYRGNSLRHELLTTVGNYEDFLKSLEMKACVRPFDLANLSRITQLINKTNQFNVTTKRRTESDVSRIVGNDGFITAFARLSDRFGDHGLVSAFIGEISSGRELRVDTWLMSCRVLKRGLELFLFQEIVRQAIKRQLVCIRGQYIPTAKNQLVEMLFEEMGFSRDSDTPGDGTFWHYDLTDQTTLHTTFHQTLCIERMEQAEG